MFCDLLEYVRLKQLQIRKLFKHFVIKAPLAALMLVLLISLSCGKRKPPVPPKERVSQRVTLSGFQRGNQVILSWKMPPRNAGRSSVLNIDRIDIYRLAEPANAPLTLSEEDFASRSTIVASLSIKETDFGPNTFLHTDELEFAGQPARLRYSMRFANASGQKAAFSNFFLIEPAAKVGMQPTSLSGDVSQNAISLNWQRPSANVDGSAPASILGYNVYRSDSEKKPGKLLNETPLKEEEYADEFFDFDKRYYYFVRAVSVGVGAEPIESKESNILEVKPVDTFAPSPPSAITLASGPDVISIFFAVNPEKDIAGYKIYRTSERTLELSNWDLITPELLTTNTFQDTAVTKANTYYYYITASDIRGNTSMPSDIVSETLR
jgi:hypothetical protein